MAAFGLLTVFLLIFADRGSVIGTKKKTVPGTQA